MTQKFRPKHKNQGQKIKELSKDGESSSSNNLCPAFSFEFLSPHYCVSQCEKNDQLAFIDQLRILGKKSWQELRQSPKHGLGWEKIYPGSISAPVPSSIKDKQGLTFIAFRFSGKKAMVGFRESHIFYIIWLDRDFTLYDHG